ncbi:hypothetical protein T484DRAFT_1823189, partial [Baffinella frigidus]
HLAVDTETQKADEGDEATALVLRHLAVDTETQKADEGDEATALVLKHLAVGVDGETQAVEVTFGGNLTAVSGI